MILKFIMPKVVYTERGIEGNQEMVKLARSQLVGKTPLERLQELSKAAELTQEGRFKKNTKDFKGMINRLAVMDGFKSVFTSFEATTAGTVTEQVIASLFDEGERQDTKESTDKGYVTDVKIGEQAYAIKTIAPKGSRGMSAWNFVNTLVKEKERGIVLLDIVKEQADEGGLKLKVAQNTVKIHAGHELINISTDKSKPLIYFNGEEEPVSDIEGLINAKQFPNSYEVRGVNKDNEPFTMPLADAIEKATKEKETARVRGFSSYTLSYKKPGKSVEIDFQDASSKIRNEILLLTQQVRKSIIELKIALEKIAKGMSEFFVATRGEKEKVRRKILDAAGEVRPTAEEATAIEE